MDMQARSGAAMSATIEGWEARVEEFYSKAPKHYRVAMTLMVLMENGRTRRGTELLADCLTPDQLQKLGGLFGSETDRRGGESAEQWFNRLAEYFKDASGSGAGKEDQIAILLAPLLYDFKK